MKAILAAALLCLNLLPARAQGGPGPKPRVEILTSYGPVVAELEPALAPRTVANFLRYVDEGYYDGTIFHRVIQGFMVQGGGMLKDLAAKPAHEPVPLEARDAFKGGLRNQRGTLAMARTDDPDSATAQFFINTVDNPGLDPGDGAAGPGYCVFGRVVAGMENVEKIEKVRTVLRRGMNDVPEYPVFIRSARRLPAP
jgi:cyclophilin family peptidyl-prolyl cis-trans isomerase